jgi:hypothetical protein
MNTGAAPAALGRVLPVVTACHAFEHIASTPASRCDAFGRLLATARLSAPWLVHYEVARIETRARRACETCGFTARERYVLMSVTLD